ncbi:hypothetical protein SAMN04487948_1105 [Halogranum amylolyticum]|uniref:Uncharacterized protein n=1 Tax=Halogranum amylolyticum TaxID=660520 RepID=A0A1H8U8R5_9EURY|nr:hypothetical protein SAMN04487948_1105 [Halogranum amylolyticum]
MTQKLVEYASHRAGDYLRVVATYSESSYSIEYVRDDIRKKHAESFIRLVVQDLCEQSKDTERMRRTFGSQYATVHAYRSNCIVHVRSSQDSDAGLIISLDKGAAKNLLEFIEGCASKWSQSRI